MRTSVMEVSIENFLFNVENIKKVLKNDTKIIPIIKANAYGTYLNTNLDILNLFDIVGVALVDEGIFLRKLGYKNEILIINPCSVDEIDDVVKYDLTISVSSKLVIENLNKKDKLSKIHLEIETGMSRTGIQLNDLDSFLKMLKLCENIKVDGIYSHMSSADCDEDFTKKQIEIFNKAVEKTMSEIDDIKYIHISASNGILNFENAQYNAVRPGLILYGFEPFEGAYNKINLKPVCRLKSKITFLKTVNSGTSVGYGQTFKTERETRIATVQLGYADGLKRCLSNKGMVVIQGIECPIIGNICMDSFMVDVTEVKNAQIGDDVWIWDNENIMIDEIAKKSNTISYEILTSISSRVPRIIMEKF